MTLENGDTLTDALVVSVMPEPAPKHFTVGVEVPGVVGGGGRIAVSDGCLECELGSVTRRFSSGVAVVRHRGDRVYVYKARLVPFWFNVGLVVEDDETAILASMPSWKLRTLIEALSAAGFSVEVIRTWTFRGLPAVNLVHGYIQDRE